LVNLIQWQNANCNLGFGDRTAQFVPYTFDVSFQEIFATLGSGGTLIVLPQDIQQQFTELPNFIAKHRINRLFLPFVGLQQLAELVKDGPTQLSDLKEIITAGEQLQSSAAIRHLLTSLPGCVLKNQYGPTEAHVVSEYILGSDPAAWPGLSGLYHATASGSTTWFGFASAIFEIAPGLARRPRLRPLATADYPLPAPRPAWSVLDCGRLRERFGITLPGWREALCECVSHG
jgi:hypothetical protein